MNTHQHSGPLAFMPWQVETDSDACGDDERPVAVIDTEGNVDGCYEDEATAQARADALNDEEPAAEATTDEVPFRAVIAVEGFETSDGRVLEVGGWNQESPRMVPLPLWVQTEQPEFGGHAGAFIDGRIESITRMDDGRRLYAEGFVSTADERGKWAEGQIRSRNLRFVSIDVGEADVEYEVREIEEDGWPTDVLARYTDYEIMGATVCASPAIAWAVIWLDGMDEPDEFTAELPEPPERVDEPEVVETGDMPLLLAAATHPPSDWFDDPELSEVTHLTVTADGRIFGHLAPWGECHIGRPGCVTAPHSATEYAHFRTGETVAVCDCDDGEHLVRVATGRITLGTDHARSGVTASEAQWHYDNTGAVVADVAAGEDEHGIWLAGAIRPGTSDRQVRQLMAADVSGDWRTLGGALDLVGVLAVNVGGFNIPRRPEAHLAASACGPVQTSLVAPFGTPVRGPRTDPRLESLNERLRTVERAMLRHSAVVGALTQSAAEALAVRIRSNGH